MLTFRCYIQITELKLTVENLEKERDFYFAKLRDAEILCQHHTVSNLPVIVLSTPVLFTGLTKKSNTYKWFLTSYTFLHVIDAINRILYASEEDASVLEEAQAMLLKGEKQEAGLSQTVEEDQSKSDSQKRKADGDVEVDGLSSFLS
ncbi:putative microtubule-associated protein RP/EB [Helianthus annuus]|nr:putative microtubule-associated protein RP/EB [Helianthus annuus]KAJ0617942.1 putative microtubule-associated protein RP/EB [Helianthus annuus]